MIKVSLILTALSCLAQISDLVVGFNASLSTILKYVELFISMIEIISYIWNNNPIQHFG